MAVKSRSCFQAREVAEDTTLLMQLKACRCCPDEPIELKVWIQWRAAVLSSYSQNQLTPAPGEENTTLQPWQWGNNTDLHHP